MRHAGRHVSWATLSSGCSELLPSSVTAETPDYRQLSGVSSAERSYAGSFHSELKNESRLASSPPTAQLSVVAPSGSCRTASLRRTQSLRRGFSMLKPVSDHSAVVKDLESLACAAQSSCSETTATATSASISNVLNAGVTPTQPKSLPLAFASLSRILTPSDTRRKQLALKPSSNFGWSSGSAESPSDQCSYTRNTNGESTTPSFPPPTMASPEASSTNGEPRHCRRCFRRWCFRRRPSLLPFQHADFAPAAGPHGSGSLDVICPTGSRVAFQQSSTTLAAAPPKAQRSAMRILVISLAVSLLLLANAFLRIIMKTFITPHLELVVSVLFPVVSFLVIQTPRKAHLVILFLLACIVPVLELFCGSLTASQLITYLTLDLHEGGCRDVARVTYGSAVYLTCIKSFVILGLLCTFSSVALLLSVVHAWHCYSIILECSIWKHQRRLERIRLARHFSSLQGCPIPGVGLNNGAGGIAGRSPGANYALAPQHSGASNHPNTTTLQKNLST